MMRQKECDMIKSFLPISSDSHFPIQNLPYGVFRTTKRSPRIGVAIGDYIFDLKEAESGGLLNDIDGLVEGVFQGQTLNVFMGLGPAVWSAVRGRLQGLLGEESVLAGDEELRSKLLVSMSVATMLNPVSIGDYTDFYSSMEHAINVGTMYRGRENALQPNWKHLPVGYHGRSSSIFAGNGNIRRPKGQVLLDGTPTYVATGKLDFELETAFFIGVGNRIGDQIDITRAEDYVFGMVLMNDWSARDIQKWEYIPLGPFLGKSFYTSISPWVVTMEALKDFKVSPPTQDPQPLPYLQDPSPVTYDIQLEVQLRPSGYQQFKSICRTNQKFLYWTMAQQLTHHTSNGCNLRTGDLLGSGTISGPSPSSLGCLLELTEDGNKTIQFENGVSRTYLEDGDTVRLTGFAQGDGYKVGFGDLINSIEPADL